MVSLNPNHLSEPDFYTDPMTALTTTTTTPPPPPPPPSSTTTTTSLEDLSKKTRKPYSMTKSRESWTEQEHDNFLKALQLFDRDWKKIEAFVGSKTVIQIRSHAQKYFLKVQKNGTCEHVPPPRPKRKAAHPYPQKAIKNAPSVSQVMGLGAVQASSAMLEPGYILRLDSSSLYRNSFTSPVVSWPHNSLPPVAVSHATKDDIGSGPAAVNNCCISSESTPSACTVRETTKVMPDFAQVYSFIGSVFDPDRSGHLQNLKQMDPIDIETVLLLMRNLSVNLSSLDFEDHGILLSSYDVDLVKVEPGSTNTMGECPIAHQPD